MANNGQGAYAPLPQNLSDSDSDKELNEPHRRMHFSNNKLMNGHDKLHHNGYIIPNHVINMKEKTGFWAMSRARKAAFIFFILLVFTVVFVFLFLLPCINEQTCPAKITNWKNEHDGVEFKGRINVIRGSYKNSISLAFITKKSINGIDGNQNGAMAVKSSNGALAWFLPQVGSVQELNCNLIDVNGDGSNDCLLLGEIGLQAIDPISAEIIWHVHTTKMLVSDIDFPKLLPDLNSDGVNEMITITDWNSNRNKVIIICGRTGRLLTEVIIKPCIEISDFKFEDNLFIYFCKNNTEANYYKVSLDDLRAKTGNSTFFIRPVRIEYFPKHGSDYILSGRKLTIENSGKCPDCKTSIRLFRDDSTQKRLSGWSYDNAYAMNPATFAFKNNRRNSESLKGHINGFILKLWQWPAGNNRIKRVNDESVRNNISEKVMLITFNDTNVHAINVSYVQITQLCIGDECQPDLDNRKDSVLISDLDYDGSQELISYSSTFRCEDDCQLVSSMEVIRLEAELPKLYAK